MIKSGGDMASDASRLRERVSLRPIGADDQAFLFEVYASTREEELAVLDWDAAQKDAFLRQQFDAQHAFYRSQFADADFQVILLDSEPVGRLYVHRRADELRLVDIALLPVHRNAGIGTMLVKGLLAEAAAGGKPVRIHVEMFTAALRLYERLGFSKVGDNGVYYLMEWSPPA